MHRPQYAYSELSREFRFGFQSEGPKGSIRKIVIYRSLLLFPYPVFNLGFGDWNEDQDRFDDTVVSNNQDMEKVLTTVVATVIALLNHYPDASIYAEGSTAARTRLYQIKIVTHLTEILQDFSVEGYHQEKWQPFQRGINYQAFLIKRT